MSFYDMNCYKEQYLKEEDKTFLKGYDTASKSIENAKENYLFDYEGGKEQKELLNESLDDFVTYLKNVIDAERTELIVGTIDNYTDEEYEELVAKANGDE